MCLIFSDVVREPVVREADDENENGSMVDDLGVHGLWQPQVMELIDVRYCKHRCTLISRFDRPVYLRKEKEE